MKMKIRFYNLTKRGFGHLQQVRVVHTHEEVVFSSSCSAADPVWFEENQIQFKNVHMTYRWQVL